MNDQPAIRTCKRCSETKGILEFDARRTTCRACYQAAAAKRQERKERVEYSDALAERIVDALASGMTVAEVTTQAAMPTPRQLRAWRRANPDFDAACLQAEQASAAAHLDKAKQVLADLEAGKLQGSDARTLFDGHMKLAAVLHPTRYGNNATIDISSQGKPLINFGAAIDALLAALPAKALPAPAIDVEAEDASTVEERTLQ
jgi:terminase small subunit-like protein